MSAARSVMFVAPTPIPAMEIIDVMVLSPLPTDHRFIESALHEAASPTRKWIVKGRFDFFKAVSDLCKSRFSVVLCEDVFPWRNLLDGPIQELPPMIVTSRVADERMWAEALNLGAFDVLAKPFDRTEVIRVVESAWLHWRHHQLQMPANSIKVMTAAS